MSDNMRWRYGDTNPVVAAVASATDIEIGDLLYLSGGQALPASSQADQLSEANNQGLFHDLFVGVAMQRSRVGDSTPIRLATTGVFEFDCPTSTFEIGDLIGAKEQSSGTQLEDQVVTKVTTAPVAIGRCVKRAASNVTKVLVDIESTIVKGGVMPPVT